MIATMEIAAVYLFMWGIWSRNHVRWGTSEIVILPQEMFAIHVQSHNWNAIPKNAGLGPPCKLRSTRTASTRSSRIWRGSSLRVWTCWWMWWGKAILCMRMSSSWGVGHTRDLASMTKLGVDTWCAAPTETTHTVAFKKVRHLCHSMP